MSTNAGLSRFDPETETFRNYGVEDGLQSLEFDLTAAYRAESGEMFFGGINGLNAFFPNELIDSSVPPEVRLVDLEIAGRTIKKDPRVKLAKPVSDLDEIRLAYDQKDVTFDFVGFHYEHPERNLFSYMLEGYNSDWSTAGTSRRASYTNLPPGEYTFRVRAANHAGIWNEEGASIRVVITPPFWATWWFRVLGLLAFAGVVYGGYRIRTAQLETRARELEGLVDERTAELKESNDQLEQSATIVEAINQETSFRRLLTKILEESRVIPGVEKATAMVRMSDGLFHVRASSGWDVEAMKDIRLTPRQAEARYVNHAEEVAEDIFVAKDVASRAGTEQLAEFGEVASFIAMRVNVEDEVAGYLVFDNLNDPDAFDQRDVDLLDRLREHIQSAFIKARILEDLQNTLNDLKSTQDRLVHSEKMASLGQLTAGIAHEIKNPLNFVNNFSEVTAELSDELASEIKKLKADMPAERLAEVESILASLTTNTKKIAEHGKRADG
ncbi:MAG: triple tyrosine motif-containing protein, partial [Rhodothermia bacterium]